MTRREYLLAELRCASLRARLQQSDIDAVGLALKGGGARLLWIELRGWLRNDWSNNGRLFLSDRDAAVALGTKSTRSIVRWYAENEHYGFLRQTQGGFLGSDGHGIAAKYRFTDLPHGARAPTRDYEKWDGELFVYRRRGSARKKQNPVSLGETPRVPRGHIQTDRYRPSVCVPRGHIGEAPNRVPMGHITSFPLHKADEGETQGSSTARAPAQAGDAGSSPAPVSIEPMCWATPRLVEVTDPVEKAAIQAYWRPKCVAKARQ
jgi:hypothetical protein